MIVNQSDTLEQYCEKVEKIKQYIREGHIFQTVLSQRWTIETKPVSYTHLDYEKSDFYRAMDWYKKQDVTYGG